MLPCNLCLRHTHSPVRASGTDRVGAIRKDCAQGAVKTSSK
ncbi:hypothetical protein SZ55_2190 [Pseudomonas sp. FeS53a]|nr:hypothetical protein SZ55_2190 [Pseudomonas sp. FeS53a]